MRTFYSFCLLLFCLSSNAQFSKGYAPSKWTTAQTAGASGSVNASGAPASITIIGSDNSTPSATPMDINYTISSLATGIFSFNWSYHTNDADLSPQYDPAGVVINGSFTQLTNDAGAIDQSGTYTASVTAGTTIGFRISALDNTMGNATFTISSFSPPAGVLPVMLVSFTAQNQKSAVQLNWSTASEINLSHFVVERSGNANNFSALKTVNANQNKQYELLDEHPLPGRNFYRLKMVDNDSTAAYSNTVAVNTPQLVQSVSVWPNPAYDECKIHITAAAPYTETFVISTSAGLKLSEQKLVLQQGANDKEINTVSLAKGIYFIHFEKADITIQLVKR